MGRTHGYLEGIAGRGYRRGAAGGDTALSGGTPRAARGGGAHSRTPVSLLRQEVGESAAAALLCGQHLLLAGPKATGKNVLAENLAAVFGRPVWDVSMYVNVDAAALIGADTLQKGEVVFREGPICRCARLGGFGKKDGKLHPVKKTAFFFEWR